MITIFNKYFYLNVLSESRMVAGSDVVETKNRDQRVRVDGVQQAIRAGIFPNITSIIQGQSSKAIHINTLGINWLFHDTCNISETNQCLVTASYVIGKVASSLVLVKYTTYMTINVRSRLRNSETRTDPQSPEQVLKCFKILLFTCTPVVKI